MLFLFKVFLPHAHISLSSHFKPVVSYNYEEKFIVTINYLPKHDFLVKIQPFLAF
jgi:hypothetical protein